MENGFNWQGLQTVLQGPGVEIRRQDMDGLAMCLLRLDEGLRTDPLFAGLPDDRCPYAHWGYIISGTMRVHRADGSQDFSAGELYHWEAGHNLEAVVASEYVEITRAEDYDGLMAHCRRVMG